MTVNATDLRRHLVCKTCQMTSKAHKVTTLESMKREHLRLHPDHRLRYTLYV